MKPFADLVTEKIEAFVEKASDKVVASIGDVPFDSKRVGGRRVVEVFDSLSPMEIDQLVQKYGDQAVANMLFEVEKTRKRLKD